MSPRRTIAAAAAALVVGAIALAPATSPSQAVGASPRLTDAQVAALTPTQPMKGRAWIEGAVRDQFGNRLGNVSVEATSADDEGSAITYEEPGIAGSTGFYRIYDLTPGTYRLRFTSADPKIKPATSTVTVGKREIGRVDARVTRVLASTALAAELLKRSVTTKQSGVVNISLTSAAKRPTGAVEVREGKHVVGDATLRRSNGGRVTVVLDKLPKGAHVLKAYFLGSSTLKASSSKTFTLTVTKAGH